MSLMFRGRSTLFRLSRRSIFLQRRTLSGNNKAITNGKEVENTSSASRTDAYKQLENLDFMTAAKMLFTEPPQKKKFGFDFHLVQFFFACLPSLAVYLVAKYARYEMRRMEAEQELKRQADEAKVKELELMAEEENQKATDPQLSEVKARLDKLEETIKEIAVVSKKQSGDVAERPVNNAVNKEPGDSKEKTTPPSEGKTQAKASLPDPKQIKNEGSSNDTSK